MAKEITPKQYEDEAKKVMREANQKRKNLLKKANEVKVKKLSELGKKTIDFLDGKYELSSLRKFAEMNGFIKEDREDNENAQ